MRLKSPYFILIILATNAYGQSFEAVNQYALIINNISYLNGAKIPINELKVLWKNSANMEVQLPSGHRIKPEVFEWVVKKDTNVWKFHTYAADTFTAPDPDINFTNQPFVKQLYTMQGSDILYFDEFQFADKPKDFPRSFQFVVK